MRDYFFVGFVMGRGRSIGTFVKARAKERNIPYKKLYDTRSCFYCDVPLITDRDYGRGNIHDDRTFEHLITKSDSGTNDSENLEACCRFCNGFRGILILNGFSHDWRDFSNYVDHEYRDIRLNRHLMMEKYPDFIKFWTEDRDIKTYSWAYVYVHKYYYKIYNILINNAVVQNCIEFVLRNVSIYYQKWWKPALRLKKKLMKSSNCFYCDIEFGPSSENGNYHNSLTQHHKITREDGGEKNISNMVAACSFCSRLRDESIRKGFSRNYKDFASFVITEYKDIRNDDQKMIHKFRNCRNMWVK